MKKLIILLALIANVTVCNSDTTKIQPSIKELTSQLADLYRSNRTWYLSDLPGSKMYAPIKSREEIDKLEAELIEKLKNHPDASKSLSEVTEKQPDAPEHDAVYVKWNIWKYLVDRENIPNLVKKNIKDRHHKLYDYEEFDENHPSWGSRGSDDQTIDIQYFWSPRCEINQNYWLSKGTLSASRYFAEKIHQGLMNPRSHQVNRDKPYNSDPENKLSLLDLLKIAEESKKQEEKDWQEIDKKLTVIEGNIDDCKKANPQSVLEASKSKNPTAALVALVSDCVEKSKK